MAEEKITFDVRQVVACDDIRREDNGKQILIGVYNDSILVPQFPAALGLSFWIQGMPSAVGTTTLAVRLVAGEAEFFNNSAPINFQVHEMSAIAFGQIPLAVQQPTELLLQSRSGTDTEWKTIKTLSVRKGSLPSQAT